MFCKLVKNMMNERTVYFSQYIKKNLFYLIFLSCHVHDLECNENLGIREKSWKCCAIKSRGVHLDQSSNVQS